MPARRRIQPQEDAPPQRRSSRIRRQIEAAASQAAEVAREDTRGLGIARSSHTIRRRRRRTLSAVEAIVQADRQILNLVVENASPPVAESSENEVAVAAAAASTAAPVAAPAAAPETVPSSAPTSTAPTSTAPTSTAPTSTAPTSSVESPAVNDRRVKRAAQRIRRELKKFHEEPLDGCQLEVGDNIFCWRVTINGPKDTPYEGGIFKLLLTFGYEYPFKPPLAKFLTKLYHCNISPEGNICLHILRANWSPALTVSTLLLSIISLFSDPFADDPLVPTHAAVYERDREEYEAIARLWTSAYAKPNQQEQNQE